MSSQVHFPPTPELSSVLPNDVIDEDSAKIPDVSIVEASAELLYGLVHQRYVLTRAGLHAMVSELPLLHHRGHNYELKYSQAEKYEAGVFGSCPRVYCMGCNVVPCGRSDLPGLETVKLFCPNCNDIYVPASSRFQGVDGMFPSASARYFFNFSTRRFLWHYIRPSFLPDLSRAYARSVLEAAIFVRFYVAVSVTAKRHGQ
jgi:casein kinase II subunit beta